MWSSSLRIANVFREGMFDFIEKLQMQSEVSRQIIAVGISLCVTAIIFFVWVSAFFGDIGSGTVVVTKEDVLTQQKLSQSATSPFDTVKESVAGIGSAWAQLKGAFRSINSIEYRPE